MILNLSWPNFWRGSFKDDKKIHMMSWTKLAKAKGTRGMGFMVIGDFNLSLLGKHFWRLLTGGSSLLERVFKSRYYLRTTLREAKLRFTPSYVWRSILGSEELVEEGTRWVIGNGLKVEVWQDN